MQEFFGRCLAIAACNGNEWDLKLFSMVQSELLQSCENAADLAHAAATSWPVQPPWLTKQLQRDEQFQTMSLL